MEQAWRWFGDHDPVSLDFVRQAGATGIVTALHHLPHDVVWSPDEIARRKTAIEAAGLNWSVTESILMPGSIKRGGSGAARAIGVWKDTLANLGRAGVPVVCYNFMPVVDWTRTDLLFPLPATGLALRFDMVDFVGYDVFVLKRRNAEANYPEALVAKARARIAARSESELATIEKTIIAGLPGGAVALTREMIAAEIDSFSGIDADAMHANLAAFLREVVPVAEEVGVRLAIHPDDPPFPLFGLPRIVSTPSDIRRLLSVADSEANGLTLCAGSYGSRRDNDVVEIARSFATRINFAHLRNVTVEDDGSFYESEHLEGRTDFVELVDVLLSEERAARREGRRPVIPMRPDHGHLLGTDGERPSNPGYSFVGRLKGLAELRGIIRTLEAGYARPAA